MTRRTARRLGFILLGVVAVPAAAGYIWLMLELARWLYR